MLLGAIVTKILAADNAHVMVFVFDAVVAPIAVPLFNDGRFSNLRFHAAVPFSIAFWLASSFPKNSAISAKVCAE
jgi:hypothetical protein